MEPGQRSKGQPPQSTHFNTQTYRIQPRITGGTGPLSHSSLTPQATNEDGKRKGNQIFCCTTFAYRSGGERLCTTRHASAVKRRWTEEGRWLRWKIECVISNRRSSNKKRRSMASNRWTSTIERVVYIYGELVQTNRHARAKSNGVF